MNNFIILIGNSRIKTYLIDSEGRVLDRRAFFLDDLPALQHYCQGNLYIASVVPDLNDKLQTAPPYNRIMLTNSDITLVRNLTEQPDKTGIDRLLNAVGAILKYPDENCLIVDCGTTVSLSVVTAQAHFLGGAILSGLNTELKLLHQATALLPQITLETIPPFRIGRDTEQALISGVGWGKIGAIKELTEQTMHALKKFNPNNTQVLYTGGDGRQLAELLGHSGYFDPDLALNGVVETLRTLTR